MILQSDHKHSQPNENNLQVPPSAPPSVSQPLKTKTKIPISSQPAVPQPPSIFTQMLQISQNLLTKQKIKQVEDFIKYRQEKVSLSYNQQPTLYLQHLITDKQSLSHGVLADIISLKNDIFVNGVMSKGGVTIKRELGTMQDELQIKISEMRRKMMSLSVLEKKTGNGTFQSVMEFRRKSYWAVPSQKNDQVKEFIEKMRRINSENKRGYKQSYLKREAIVESQLQRQQQMKEAVRKQMQDKELQKMASLRKQRQKFTQEEQKKRENIQNMLRKLHATRPAHVKNQEQYIKRVVQPMQEERQRRLQQIRAQHHPYDQQEIDQHVHRYQQYKQSLFQQRAKKKEEIDELKSNAEKQVVDMFHGKFHKQITPRFYNSAMVERQAAVKKVKDYMGEVKEKHKPEIDLSKRAKIQQTIRQLQLSLDRTKRKVKKEDGSIVIENVPQTNGKKLGVSYLHQLREYNEGKPRKEQRSESMMEMTQQSKIKRIDYLRENRPNVKLKKTMGEWKKVLGDASCSPREKYEAVMQQAAVMQEKAKIKGQEMKAYKAGDKALKLKEQMDRYYMQSVAAKMVVLKDVILKQ